MTEWNYCLSYNSTLDLRGAIHFHPCEHLHFSDAGYSPPKKSNTELFLESEEGRVLWDDPAFHKLFELHLEDMAAMKEEETAKAAQRMRACFVPASDQRPVRQGMDLYNKKIFP